MTTMVLKLKDLRYSSCAIVSKTAAPLPLVREAGGLPTRHIYKNHPLLSFSFLMHKEDAKDVLGFYTNAWSFEQEPYNAR